MKNEAKFSVILPGGNYSAAQIETFEQTAHKYDLPVSLPLRSDKRGNLIIASGMNLRDAQLLRRQVSGCGYAVDVISDNPELNNTNKLGTTTAEVNFDDIPDLDGIDPCADLTVEALSGFDLSGALDLGLSDGADLDGDQDWIGDAWLAPDNSKTFGLQNNDENEDSQLGKAQLGQAILGKSTLNTKQSFDPCENSKLTNSQLGKSGVNNPRLSNSQLGNSQFGNSNLGDALKDDLSTRQIDFEDFKAYMEQETNSEFDMLAVELVDAEEKPVISDAITMNVTAPQREVLEEAIAKLKAESEAEAKAKEKDISEPQKHQDSLDVPSDPQIEPSVASSIELKTDSPSDLAPQTSSDVPIQKAKKHTTSIVSICILLIFILSVVGLYLFAPDTLKAILPCLFP